MTSTPITNATPKQIDFIKSLLATREFNRSDLNVSALSRQAASNLIESLLECPKKQVSAPNSLVGVYLLPDNSLVKVQANKAKTSEYALVWESINGERLNLNSDVVHGQWTYSPALKSQVKEEYRLTLEQAKTFTLRFGQCVRCSRKLVAAKSVMAAIGPVCAKTFKI